MKSTVARAAPTLAAHPREWLWLAAGLALSLAAFAASAWTSLHVFEGLAHLEDEIALLWQARVIARGALTTPTPVCPECFLVPFVIDLNGLRFGKYPIGWPVVLSFGELAGLRAWVNPLLAGCSVWWAFRLARRLAGPFVACLTGVLLVSSPFFLLNSGSLLSHTWSLLLTLVFTAAWLDWLTPRAGLPRWLPGVTAALCLGNLALTRPLTAVAIALPFVVHALARWARRPKDRLRLLGFALAVAGLASLHFVWQYAVTGDPLLNPYTLWWPYDQIGFGPGVGLQPGGYKPSDILPNLYVAAYSIGIDTFGWPNYGSLVWIPLGLWAIRRKPAAWLASAVFPALVLAYTLYWIPSWLFGPRYYFEGLFSLAFLSAAGFCWAAGLPLDESPVQPPPYFRRARFGLAAFALALPLAANVFYYLPIRLNGMRGLYGASQAALAPFTSPEAQSQTPALVIVDPKEDWMEYGALIELSSPWMDSPYLFTISNTPADDEKVRQAFPERTSFYYRVK